MGCVHCCIDWMFRYFHSIYKAYNNKNTLKKIALFYNVGPLKDKQFIL